MRRPGLGLGFLFAIAAAGPAAAQQAELVERGKYIFQAAGCLGCHTDVKKRGAPLAGGRALPTPFGTFYSPNITPDPTHGIGSWSESGFIRALREGVGPDGMQYFPAFPYPAFTKMTDADMKALWAYLKAQPPEARPNQAHALNFPFGFRFLNRFWKLLYFEPGAYVARAGQSAEWNRGAYLVQAMGHCGECHTPRNSLGGLDAEQRMAGTKDGPEGETVPNITPDLDTGIGEWSADDFDFLMTIGMLPDGDFVGSVMAEVVENTTGKLRVEDRKAIHTYLKSLPPIHNKID